MIRFLFTTLFISLIGTMAYSQQNSNFDDINISPDTFLNGSDESGGFNSGDAFFPNIYNSEFGYWQGGWAISSVKDSVTGDFTNLYGAKTNGGYNSDTYAVGQQNSIIKLSGDAIGKPVQGIYVTNGTYAHTIIRTGNMFSKKFGGLSGNDPDYFKLTIRNYNNGTLSQDSVDFYLADYRFEDNSQDYIVDTWVFVPLTALGNTDSLHFEMASTDAGMNGINTPLFFCIDDLTLSESTSTSSFTQNPIAIFPNPASDFVQLTSDASLGRLQIYNALGQVVFQKENIGGEQKINLNTFEEGLYFAVWEKEDRVWTGQLVIR